MSNEPPFKRITLDIEEETFRALRNEIGCKRSSILRASASIYTFVAKLVKKVEAGEDSWYVEKKGRQD